MDTGAGPAPRYETSSTLAFDQRNREAADWQTIREHVRPGVASLSEYRTRTLVGLVTATAALQDSPNVCPTPKELLTAHFLAFSSATKDAGGFRRPGQFATFGGLNGAEAQRVQVELELLEGQMTEMWALASTDQQKCAAIAFYHGRFIGIHPFRDGNGRLGRAIMASQLEKAFPDKAAKGVVDSIAESRPSYISATNVALKENDLSPLTDLVCRGMGIEPPSALSIPSPFNVRSRRMLSLDDQKPLAEESTLARTGEPMPLSSDGRSYDGPML